MQVGASADQEEAEADQGELVNVYKIETYLAEAFRHAVQIAERALSGSK